MYGEGDGAGAVGFAPAAEWADLPAFVPGRPAPADGIEGGRRFWLSDSQVDIRGGRMDWLARVTSEVVSADGLQAAGQISVDLDPTYQRLDLHFVRVLRGGETREIDLPQVLSVFRRERDLERAMYDGRLTAHIVVPDVRVGDVIDFAYTLSGAHPTLKGWFAAGATMQWNCWVETTRLRLLADADRPIASHGWGGAPAVRTTPFGANGVERVWTQLNDPGQRDEPEVPAWVTTHAGVRVADVMTWAQVADVFWASYATPEVLPADLERVAAEIEAAEADPAGRAARALTQVQRDLRYHSVSLGEGGFTPRPVERIWATRAGDCKDASRLLTALMRRLGLDACPALVNTFTGQALADRAPDIHAFNHCIVRLRIGEHTYWLDPTNYPQGGRLEAMTQARSGWALPLIEGAGLEAMGEGAPERVFEVREVFELEAAEKGGGVLSVDALYRGWRADAMRRRLSSEGAGRTLEDYRQFYERIYGEVRVLGELEIEDDLAANTLRIRERHHLSKAWKPLEDGRREFTTVDELLLPQFTLRRVGQRRHPIELGLPREMVCETIIKVQDDINLTEWDDRFTMDGIEVNSSLGRLGPREFVLKRRTLFSRRWLRADEAAPYFDLREGALRSAGVTLWVRPAPLVGIAAGKSKGKNKDKGLPTFAVVWLVIVVALFLLKVIAGAG